MGLPARAKKNGVGMRIAVDLTALADNFTGIERYALNMTLELLKQDDQNTYELIFKEEVHPEFSLWMDRPNIHMHVLKRCRKLLFNQWRLPRYLNRLKTDRYLFLAFPMPLLLQLHGGYVLGTIHDMGCWDCPETMKRHMVWYFRLSYWWMSKKARCIITISEFSKSRIQEILKVPEEKIVVAYCGLSENFRGKRMEKSKWADRDEQTEANERTGRPEKTEQTAVAGSNNVLSIKDIKDIKEKYHLPASYYLCLSTLEPRKNLLFLLNVYLELCREGRMKTPLVLAGRKGWKIEELLEQANAEKNGQVTVTGFIDDSDLPEIYRQAKCFLFPSIYEGFGIPPLEAMSQGVPVISSDASSMPEVLGDAVIYFRSNDAGSLKEALVQLEEGDNQGIKERIALGYARAGMFQYEEGAEALLKYM